MWSPFYGTAAQVYTFKTELHLNFFFFFLIFVIVGNKLTLETRPKERGLSTRDELLKFHNSFYSANIMALTVLGRGKQAK